MRDFSVTPIIELATIVAEHLTQQGIEVVLVGGLAVEIYTDNLYLTKDIDMVNVNYQSPQRLHKAMAELGFEKLGRVYVNPTTDIAVEFPSGPLSVGDEMIQQTAMVEVVGGSIPILTIADVVKDRLAAFIHWQDNQSLIQAVAVMLKHQCKPEEFHSFCTKEADSTKYALLKRLYHSAQENQVGSMEELESLLTKILLDKL